MSRTPERTMGLIYRIVLFSIIGLLIAAGIFSWLNGQADGGREAKFLIRVYLFAIPVAILLFSIIMACRRVVSLAISGAILSILWLVFAWIG